MTPHSVLIVGCGSIGERHLRCFLHTKRATVTATDTSAAILARVKETYGVATSTDWFDEVKSGRHDIAVICTPASLHVGMATRALEHGLHVLIEKPLSQSLDGVDALLAARERSGRQVGLAYVYHTFPALREVSAFLRAGSLGPIRQAVVTAGQPFHVLRPGYAKTYYHDHRTGGGAIQDALTHLANWIESILGPTESVVCDCAHLVLPEVEVEDTVHLAARHPHALCSYSLNQFQAPNENYIQLNAAAGSIRIELHRQRWGTFTAQSTDWEWRVPTTVERDGHFTNQAIAFLDQVDGRTPALCSLEAGIQTLRFNLAALASVERGARVSCATLS
ncbi:MAG: Gfo/Idh/MocA family oxidoreductase [Opitutaceae bacterium]